MSDINLISPYDNPVIAEIDRIFERPIDMPVHHKENETDNCCSVCFKTGQMVWVSSLDQHAVHSNRCGG